MIKYKSLVARCHTFTSFTHPPTAYWLLKAFKWSPL